MRKDWSKLLPVIQNMLREGKSVRTIAETIDVNRQQLLVKMSKWRTEGVDVPYEPDQVQDGEIRIKVIKGIEYRYIKLANNKWKSQGRIGGREKQKPGRKPSGMPRKPQKSRYVKKIRVPKPPKPEKVRKAQVYKQPKRVDKILPDRVVDETKYKYVKIGDNKTTIRVKIEIPDEVAIAKWIKGREDALNLLKKPGNNRIKL